MIVYINNPGQLDSQIDQLREKVRQMLHTDSRGKSIPVEIEVRPAIGQRTLSQNAALHLFFTHLADCLNTAGLDMRHVIRKDVEIPWTQQSVKQYLWKPLEKAMFGHNSTTEASKTDYGDVYDTLCRHLSQRFGVTVPPWPEARNGN